MSEHHASVFESPIDEIRAIVGRNLFPIFAGMMSQAFFSHHSEHSAAEDYVRLKQLLQIDGVIDGSSLAMLRDFEKKSPKLYQHMIQELQCQVATKVLRGGGGLHDHLFMGTLFLTYGFPSLVPDLDSDKLRHFMDRVERGDFGLE